MAEAGRLARAMALGPVLMDAAMGTRLIARGLDLGSDDPCLWNLARPEDIVDVHRRDVSAGADALLTNTFGANRRWLRRFGRGDEARAINARAVDLARQAGPGKLIFGSIGPSAGDDVAALAEQVEALAGAGVDALLFETFGPVGPPIDEIGSSVMPLPPILLCLVAGTAQPGPWAAVGCNCLELEATLQVLGEWGKAEDVPLIAMPSAGMPGRVPTSPARFADAVPRLLDLGVRLMGGCCGSTEAHVAAVRGALDAAIRRDGPLASDPSACSNSTSHPSPPRGHPPWPRRDRGRTP